ncbi:MAG: hypothetical protein JOS17DRAFT_766546 [Linnemannia elongata]|nr:MAG: hypothetical protein JOS17DRAFT_766546 [Linnemannia elongata]
MLAMAMKNKDKRDSSLLPTCNSRLSTESSNMFLDNGSQPLQDGVCRRQSVMDVNNKALQRKQWKVLAISMFFDVVLPIILYYTLKSHMSAIAALLISSAPPAINCVTKFVVYRKVDPIGLLIIFGFVLSAILSVIDGNPRLILLRDSLVTCASGLIFLASLIPIKIGKFQVKPLTYGVSAQMMTAAPSIQYFVEGNLVEQSLSEFCWQWSRRYRRGMRTMTAVWGIALLLEFTLRLIFYFSSMTLDHLVMWGNIVLVCTLGTAGLFTIASSHFVRKWTTEDVALAKAQLERDHEYWEAAHSRQRQQQQQEQQQQQQPQQQ